MGHARADVFCRCGETTEFTQVKLYKLRFWGSCDEERWEHVSTERERDSNAN